MGGGKNKFDIEGWFDSVGATYTKDGDSYTITAISALFSTPFVFADEDTTVTFSVEAFTNGTTENVRIDFLNSSGTVVSSLYADYATSKTVTASKMRFNWSTAGTFTISKPQLESGSTATSYAPYSNICPITGWQNIHVYHGANQTDYDTITAQLGSTYYAGTVDVVSGVGSVTMAVVTLDENQTYYINTSTDRNRITWGGYESVGKTGGTFVSDMLETIPNTSGGYGTADWQIFGSTVAPRMWIIVPTSIDTVDKFKAYVAENPITVCYELATPISFSVTGQTVQMLKDNNVLWTDADNISLTYKASS